MSLNMHGTQNGYHSITNFYKMLKFNLFVQKNVKMQRRMGRFALYSVALTTGVRT